MVGEQGRQLGEGEEDEELLAVFMGAGGGKRGSRLEQLVQRAREGVLAAEKEEKATSLSMTKAKEQVGDRPNDVIMMSFPSPIAISYI